MNTKFKFGKRQIVLTIVAVLLLGVLIGGNVVLSMFSGLLHKLFDSLLGGNSGVRGDAFEMGDAMVAQLVEDSAVLLRNEDNALPLDPTSDSENKVNLFGWNATTDGFLLTGTGSGGSPVYDDNRVTLAEAFEQAGYEYNKTLLNAYASESGANGDKINKYGQFSGASMQAIHNPGASFYTADRMNDARAYSDVAIIVLSRNTGENCGNGETLDVSGYSNGKWLELTANEKTMLEKVSETFADGKVIVLLNTTNTMELGFLEDYNVDAALYIGAVGQSGARAIPHLLYGQKTVKDEDGKEEIVQISPSGRTSDTYAYEYNVVDGKVYNPTWASTISNDKSIYYQEGIYIGYKWYETADVEGFFDEVSNKYGAGYDGVVQYPFGYGLSYTSFKWTVTWPTANELTLDGEYEVKVRVDNVGNYAGKEVVELYYTPPYNDGEIEKAEINLLAFAKTPTIEPTGHYEVTLKFSAYDLASYDDYDKNDNKFRGYELDEGTHVLKLMSDAHNLAASCVDSRDNVSNTFNMSCKGVKFENDPVTGTKVENLFTGDTAYSGTPIDGSKNFNGGIDYLSRKGSFANFPKVTTYTCKAPNSKPNQEFKATAYWNNADVSSFNFGEDNGLYLFTKEDGSPASDKEINSADTVLIPDKTLMEILLDYDDPMWDLLLNQLSYNDISELITKGQFETQAIASVGKPYATELDGPSGFNRNSVAGAKSDPDWVVFPVEILLGCSWNTEVTYQMGRAMGVIANGELTTVHGWYGPGLNLHRSPYYGRNFEYYSEDAVLTGKLAAACVKGAKEYNLTCYLKHYVCADTGPNSPNWLTWLTEQNLRENYLRAFEIAVKEGKANAMMSGFSAVGAMWAGANYALSTQVLRNEWGFRGSMITDWYNGYMDVERGIMGGNDLWLGSASLSLSASSSNAVKYCARQSAKNILYNYVDTFMAAENGPDSMTGGGAAYSPVFAAIWALADIGLILGIGACVLHMFVTRKQLAEMLKRKKAPATAEGEQTEAPSTDETQQ